MIAFWLTLPLGLRFLLIGVIGLIGGGLANHIIYAFAYYNPRQISPWGPAPEDAPPRQLTDRIPVLGWFGLRRESPVHGNGFWIRPILIELATAIGLLLLYRFETSGGLLPLPLTFPAYIQSYAATANQIFYSHLILMVLMMAATVIDFDEKIIPDVITIPGTIIALIIGACTVFVFMPTGLPVGPNGAAETVAPTTFDSPWFHRPNEWLGTPGLSAGLAIWTVWCFALCDRRWSGMVWRRRGLSRAIKHFVNGVFHYGFWKVLAAIWLIGVVGISWVWSLGGQHWLGLFTSLVGLAVGGGVIWAIRIIAAVALNKEAMGFGDVTLMAMIGAFLGWQAALIAFFLSPFTAIVIVLVRYIITRDAYTPYGPYLCAGAVVTIVFWDGLYNNWLAFNLLVIGAMLMWLCVVMLVLMAVMLFVWRMIKERLFAE
ncbi:MAG: A24 family peptidase [Rubripirellula sp.]